ncbi:glycerophosphoryl diester phosphodiesterase [Asanoa ferruginea]|uniref:Glycerophosphoryl diester phosphodiesterase n=1 Tax=Asanoa ferruginea TaxID=53367 RepID=A0A3D9ZWB3_9ACTN|nr:glycerophosphodiester phosphodiesterase [Asanoa ferruginea]REG00833.1 glycerophosphoryl diester phosphodiesterase [Asanoa ferruginea]GIF47292.1 hypothetical protein Afe04nite_18310 [Asanoa ferruginea]
MNGGPGLIAVAHRGGNRMADLRAALASGVDAIEADVHFIHGTLRVRHGAIAVSRHAPTLEEILTTADGGPRLLLDLKGPSLAVADEVAAMLSDRFPDLPVAVCTKQWRMFDAFAEGSPVQRVYTARTSRQLTRLRFLIRRSPVGAASVRQQLLNPDVVDELRAAGVTVLVWPVDSDAALADARRLGADGVIGKNLALLRSLVTEREATSGWR